MSSKHAAHRATADLFFALLEFLKVHPHVSKTLLRSTFVNSSVKTWHMERNGYIKNTNGTYALTPKGKAALTEERIWKLSIKTPKQWDRKWRLVLFDIPVDKRKRRDIFRLRLKELGLVLYQDSVWIYPYPLEKVVQEISGFYFLSNCISYIVAESVTGEERLLKHFQLS